MSKFHKVFNVLVFGDSNAFYGDHQLGWLTAIRDKYRDKASFTNFGVRSLNSTQW